MKAQTANTKTLTRLMFKLLPAQVLLMTVSTINGLVSSFFATNYVGVDAMTAVGLYGPVNLLLGSVSTMLFGGAVILCGKYMGQNESGKMQNIFSLDIVLSLLIAAAFTILLVIMAVFDLTGFMAPDAQVRPLFNRYILGQTIGILPFVLGGQLQAFLFIEHREKRAVWASIVYIAVNLMLNFLFVKVMKMEAFGLAAASSLGMWAFFFIEAGYFIGGKSVLRLSLNHLNWAESRNIIVTGFPGAATNGYQTLRGFIVNGLLAAFVGSAGISAFAAANNLLALFWAIPAGMQSVSRMLISVSVGEEDRRTLTDVMRVMIRRFVPLMCAVAALLIACAVPLTRIFFHDPSEPVFMMTVWAIRILPLCMPLAVVAMHFVCYGQAAGKHGLVHIMAVMDGVVCVAGFSAVLIGAMGVNGVYTANVLNGIVIILIVIGYAWIRGRRFPRNLEELMAIPEDFGVAEDDRMDMTVMDMDDVVRISQQVQAFCESRGIDSRRSHLAGLAMEEMAGNIVDHGFVKDNKKHSVDVRVVRKDDDVILRLRDDCVPFDPGERMSMASSDDITKNIGIRMIFRMATDVQYQNILGLNVLTVRI